MVQSAVFPLYLAGCMAGARDTEGMRAWEEIKEVLLREDGGTGNRAKAVEKMEMVWQHLKRSPSAGKMRAKAWLSQRRCNVSAGHRPGGEEEAGGGHVCSRQR